MGELMGLISTNYSAPALSKVTQDRPIASLPYGGRYRLIDFALSSMENSRVTTVGLITPYMYRSLMDHVGVGKEWSLNRKIGGMFILPGSVYGYRNRQGKFLIRDLLQNVDFIKRGEGDILVMTASDKICNIDYRDVAREYVQSGADITLVYTKNPAPEGATGSRLILDDTGRVMAINEDGGNSFLDSIIIRRNLLLEILDWYTELNYMDFVEAIRENLGRFNIRGYEYKGFVAWIETLGTYMEANMSLLREDVREELFLNEQRPIHTKVQDAAPAKYLAGASVKNALVPTGCTIEGTVENSVLFRGVHIGKGAVVRNCVIMQKGYIGEGAVLENVICDKFVVIEPGAKLCGSPSNPIVVDKREVF